MVVIHSRPASIIIIAIFCFIIALPSYSQDYDDMIEFSLEYELPRGEGPGDAIISLAVHIDEGYPLSGKRFATEQLLIIYKQLWAEEPGHEDALQSLFEEQIPPELKETLKSFDGAELLLMMVDAFEKVEDAGMLYFDEPVDIVYAETLPYYPGQNSRQTADASGAAQQKGMVNFVLDTLSDEDEARTVINGNLINISAAILSYRSEYLVFPLDLGELEARGHLLVNLTNPYSGLPVRNIADDVSIRPGDIRYDYSGPDRVGVMSYLADGSNVRRAINLYSSGEFDQLYKMTPWKDELDRRVCIYVFQLSHIINEYYHTYGILPDKVPQIESKMFASVGFLNPFTNEPVKQVVSPLDKTEGDYFYYKTSDSQYVLIGYGKGLAEAIKIQRRLEE